MNVQRCPQCLQELREIALLTSVEYECGCNSPSAEVSIPEGPEIDLHRGAPLVVEDLDVSALLPGWKGANPASPNFLDRLLNDPLPGLIRGAAHKRLAADLSDFVGQPVKQEVIDAIKARLDDSIEKLLTDVGFPWRPM